MTTHRGVEASSSQLRLTLGIAVRINAVSLENLHDRESRQQRISQRRRPNEVQIVRGRVVLRIAPVGRAGQYAHWQIEAWGAVLAFVVTVRRKVLDIVGIP